MKNGKQEISDGLIQYYAEKKGISFQQAEYELKNTYGYEEEKQIDESIFEISKYNTSPINPFKSDLDGISVFECA